MGNFCSVPMPFRMRNEEQEDSVSERGHVDLIRQLSYDIYKIQGVQDSRDDFEEYRYSRRPSKPYYQVSKSMPNRVHPQVRSASSSFGSATSVGTATTTNWTRSQKHSSTQLGLEELVHAQQLHTETSSPSSRASASSSSDTLESNQSDQAPSVDLALEQPLEESARVEESH